MYTGKVQLVQCRCNGSIPLFIVTDLIIPIPLHIHTLRDIMQPKYSLNIDI